MQSTDEVDMVKKTANNSPLIRSRFDSSIFDMSISFFCAAKAMDINNTLF